MNLTSIREVRSLLADLGIHPNKALGQNFLIDLNILNILLDTAGISSKDSILEVGPGLGVVTERLLQKARHVIAVEKDDKLFSYLKNRFVEEEKLELICADMLDVDMGILSRAGVNKLVSNLPYSAGGRILVNLTMSDVRIDQITVTMQEEVAQRLAAKPGNKSYGSLTVWIQADYEVTLGKVISPTCFWPRPEVQSVIVNMNRRGSSLIEPSARAFFHEITKRFFMYRRKQIATIIGKVSGESGLSGSHFLRLLKDLGIDPTARPENLSVDDWCRLAAEGRRYKSSTTDK
jgi:16S rRNA (adenine1518-N6/adenine1519-N6)-dimethyltransferase